MATKGSSSAATLLQILFFSFLSNLCLCSVSDFNCLKTLKESLIDPNNILASWNFDNNTEEGSICRFTGVECWHPNENKVLNLHLSRMGLSGQFPMGLENCFSLTGLDLSNNKLSGSIPMDISRRIPYVTTIDLSFNDFSGEIPVNLSQCTYLSTINLQHNQLEGEIPWQLSRLDRLTTLNVSGNLLSGPIPTFRTTFAEPSFADNQDLCGRPLQDCKGPPKKKVPRGVIIISAVGGAALTIAVLGFVMLLLLAIGTMKRT